MKVALRTHNGHYLVAEDGGGGQVNANRTVAHSWETFHLVKIENQHVLITHNGHLLTSTESGSIESTETDLSNWDTKFIHRDLPGRKVGIKFDSGYLVAEEGGGGAANANRERLGPWETWGLYNLDAGEVPPVYNPNPTLQALSVQPNSRWLHTDKPFDYREATAMGLYRLFLDDNPIGDDFVSYLKAHRFNAARVLLNLDSNFWISYKRNNSYHEAQWFEKLIPFVRYMASHGFYVRICIFGGVEPFGAVPNWETREDVVTGKFDVIREMKEHATDVSYLLRNESNVLLEVANEPSQIGFGDNSNVILELGEIVKQAAPNRIMNFGCANNEDSTFYAREPSDMLDEHLRRIDIQNYFWSVKRIWEHHAVDVKKPFISGEWFNMGLKGTSSTAVAFCSAAALRIKKAIPAFHANSFVLIRLPSPEATACVDAWHRGLDAVPMNFEGSPCNGHWPCSPVDSDEFPESEEESMEHEGPLRVFGLDGPSGYIGVSIREPKNHVMKWKGAVPTLVDSETWGEWKSAVYKLED